MKIFLCLLLIKICSCADSEQQSNNYWRGLAYDDGNYGYQQRGPIERPCSLQDLNCIKQYFALNSRCSPVRGPSPDAQRIKVIPMSIPHVNITFVLYDSEVKGFNDFKINEFYINKQTDKLVLEVEFRKLFVYAPYTVIKFHRKGMEPIVLADYVFIEYKDLSITLIAPNIRDIKLSEAEVYTYVNDINPRQGLGPNFTESKEPQVQFVTRRLIERIGLSMQEAFITKGPILLSAFLQNSICSY